ncbi:uncharacterized protein MEPE_00720 [Melanopsichium pennsylvanicum]|uniref:Uncharacterized protein n=1 Tax=Melanopsichium pennsylvanicum TaxID=63383 RepID=A0AAJ4XH59_9BASI|nr:uncharacterized protein MEPE_00720 [Melanopsichium pennsylvanicum]
MLSHRISANSTSLVCADLFLGTHSRDTSYRPTAAGPSLYSNAVVCTDPRPPVLACVANAYNLSVPVDPILAVAAPQYLDPTALATVQGLLGRIPPSWVPAEDVDHAPDLVAAYHAANPTKPAPTRR